MSLVLALIGLYFDDLDKTALAAGRRAVPIGHRGDGFNGPLLDRHGQLAQVAAHDSHLVTGERKREDIAILARLKFPKFQVMVGEQIKRIRVANPA